MKTKLAILLASCFALIVIALVVFVPKSPAGGLSLADSSAGQTSQSQQIGEDASPQASGALPAETPASEGATYAVDEDGSITEDTEPEGSGGTEVMVRLNPNTQKAEYSTDGGKTWTTELPEKI